MSCLSQEKEYVVDISTLKQRTRQIHVCGIFVEHSHDVFPEYLENVPYEIPGNIPKIMFWEY